MASRSLSVACALILGAALLFAQNGLHTSPSSATVAAQTSTSETKTPLRPHSEDDDTDDEGSNDRPQIDIGNDDKDDEVQFESGFSMSRARLQQLVDSALENRHEDNRGWDP